MSMTYACSHTRSSLMLITPNLIWYRNNPSNFNFNRAFEHLNTFTIIDL